MNITIVFSVKRAVKKYILCYTFIHKLMSNRQIYLIYPIFVLRRVWWLAWLCVQGPSG